MADLTSIIKKPGTTAAAPSYSALSSADFFTGKAGARYRLHYKNGATPGTGLLKITDPTTPIPPGSPATAGFADLSVVTNMGATTELVVIISAGRHMDGSSNINLVNAGTLTTITVGIEEMSS